MAHIIAMSIVMYVVIADIPTRFGMFLSRSLGAKLVEFLKWDFTYGIIIVFGVDERRLYRETIFLKTISKEG